MTDFSSSTQAELAAIKLAVDHARTSHKLDVLINTDSRTAIASLFRYDNENQRLTQAISTAARAIQTEGRVITINWIPSHVGTSGNEKADLLAKQAAQLSDVSCDIPRTQQQPRCKTRQQAERRRLQRESETQHGDSTSARWMGQVDTDNPLSAPPRPQHQTPRAGEVQDKAGLPLCLGAGDRHARGEKTVPPV